MKCLIVDDDPLVCDLLDFYCNKIKEISSVTKAESGFETINLLNGVKFDIVFLDFNLPDLTGREILNVIPKSTAVVMITSNKDFALDSYDYEQIVDFLAKPVDFTHFFRGFQKAKSFMSGTAERKGNIFIKDGNKLVSIDLDKVLYFKSEGNYISVVFEDRKILSLMTMKDLVKKLPSHFQRVHRSFIVNLDAVQSINSSWIEIGEQEIPVSQSYEKELLKKINFLN